MNISTTKTLQTTGSHIVLTDALFTILELTIPTHTPHTKESEALRLVYVEALMSGCATYSRDAFIDALTILGATITIQTQDDSIHFSVKTRNENLKKTLSLFEQMLLRPTFENTELTRIKKHIVNNLILAQEDAVSCAHDNFVRTLVHPQDRRFDYELDTVMGEVKKVSKQHVTKFHKILNKFVWTYTCGGNEQCVSVIQNFIKKLRKNAKLQTAPEIFYEVKTLPRNDVKLFDIPHKQNIEFSIGAPLHILSTHNDYPALFFGMTVLANPGGFSGRLMSIVREKEGLTYMIYGQVENISPYEMGYWRIRTYFSPEKTLEGIQSTLREIKKITSKGITEDELRSFKVTLKTRFALVEDSLIKKVREVHSYTSRGITEAEFDNFKLHIQNMTRGEVNSALKRHLNPMKLLISGAGPIQSVKKELEKFKVV